MDFALNGFKSIWPCNRCVFRDEDFSASMLVIENSLGTEPTQAVTSETETPSIDTFTQENLTAATMPLRNETPEKENLENVAPIASIATTPHKIRVELNILSPIPHLTNVSQQLRKGTTSSMEITSTPYKEEIENTVNKSSK